VFGGVVDEYDRARPGYPDAVFDAIEPLAGMRVVDVGAGTGIATRMLEARGAVVIAVDVSHAMLRRAVTGHLSAAPVVGDGASLPLRSGCADVLCFAQSWHWLDPERRPVEAARVLGRDGRWCGWWSHGRADGEPWFDRTWSAIEASCPGTHRSQRDTDWGGELARSELFTVADRVTVPWVRRLRVDQWITDFKSHSYVAALPTVAATQLLERLRTLAVDRFPDGAMSVPYETWLWRATRAAP
jgi:SAM-dependent methyltransferase